MLLLFALPFALLLSNTLSQNVLAQSLDTEKDIGESAKNSVEVSSDSETIYKYCGNSFSHKFHRPSCPFGEAISKRHLVMFRFRHEAIEAHYEPCRYCLPPIWCRVHGVLLPKQENSNLGQSKKEQ